MFKLGPTPNDTTTTNTPNAKGKKPDQEPLIKRNNLQQTTKKDYVENVVKTAFDTPANQPASNSKADDYLDRQIFQKADLDYIPGLDYDLGPVLLPSKSNIAVRSDDLILKLFVLASLDKLPGLNSPEAIKARAEEAARKKEAEAAAEAEARRKEQARVVKPILEASSMFIFSNTNP